jgi:hypothetical protein
MHPDLYFKLVPLVLIKIPIGHIIEENKSREPSFKIILQTFFNVSYKYLTTGIIKNSLQMVPLGHV